MNAQFVYTKQSISPLLFRPEALGTEIAVRVGGHAGQVCLPRLGNVIDSFGFRRVSPPQNFDAGVLHLIYDRENKISWGHQVSLPGGESLIRALLFEFRLAKVKPKARDQMAEVERHVVRWFGLLRDWIEVLTHQDLSIEEPLRDAVSYGNYMWSWRARSICRNTTSSSGGTTITVRDRSQAITLQQWQKAIHHANQGLGPPEPHLLLRDARARYRRKHYKYSAIFAGIAAEVVVKQQVEQELRIRRNPEPFIDQILSGTLGRLVTTCKTLSINVPTNITTDLINARNRAIHKNEVVTAGEAKKALDVASQIVKGGFPL